MYLVSNRYTLGQAHFLPLTILDIKIPFWPWTALIYVSVYIFPLSIGFLVDRKEDLYPILGSFLIMATACTLVFVFYPTAYPRPPLTGENGSFILRIVRSLDTPANCLPSQHVAIGFLSAFFVQRYNRLWGSVALVLGIFIAISTLTTKQHYIWDVVAGYFLARIIFALASLKLVPSKVAQ